MSVSPVLGHWRSRDDVRRRAGDTSSTRVLRFVTGGRLRWWRFFVRRLGRHNCFGGSSCVANDHFPIAQIDPGSSVRLDNDITGNGVRQRDRRRSTAHLRRRQPVHLGPGIGDRLNKDLAGDAWTGRRRKWAMEIRPGNRGFVPRDTPHVPLPCRQKRERFRTENTIRSVYYGTSEDPSVVQGEVRPALFERLSQQFGAVGGR
ncbi:hypothetical protein B5P44_00845 [Mycobacterium sp. CBMA 213]|nr:hypothetical protein [Mycolicibacterium sp. CBMA 213]